GGAPPRRRHPRGEPQAGEERRGVSEGGARDRQGQEPPLPRASGRQHHLPRLEAAGGLTHRVLVLGIETSCADSAAAALRDGGLAASVVSSQHAVHGPYGGVVPELASREHVRNVLAVIDAALGQAQATLDDVGGIAVTRGPGLIGSLLV